MTDTANRTLLGIGGILLLAWGVAQPQTTVRMEAEDMQLDTYRIEVLDFASNGALINLKGEGFVGTATAPFPGVGGEYDISVVYHDENDGLAQLTVSIDDREVDSWTLDERVKGGEQPIEANRFTREIATDYAVATGDEITINGLQGNWDHANVDYIEFVPAGEPTLGEAIVLDFTDPDDCVIEKPGYYVLDRNWDFDSVDSPAACSQLVINTNSQVVLNLRGYSIAGSDPGGVVSLPGSVPDGANLTIQDGEIAGDIYTFHGSLVFKDMGLRGTLEAQDTDLFIMSSKMHGALVIKLISTAACSATVIRNSEFSDCVGFPMNACLFVDACESTIIRDNQFAGTAQLQGPGRGVFIGNVLQMNGVGLADGQAAIEIGFASNIVVARNIIDMPNESGIGILMRGSPSRGNIVDGNVIQHPQIGIKFGLNVTGNFYGNNRVSATKPFVGTEAQVDWGGNVFY